MSAWHLYCRVCSMYALPGLEACDYCHGPLVERARSAAATRTDLPSTLQAEANKPKKVVLA
jgi:hypothetical protein